MDVIKDKYLVHPVLKIWNGIVSCGDYTIETCKRKKLGLRLVFEGKEMSIPLEKLENTAFHLHKKVVPSKYGRPYTMYDFAWKTDEELKKQLQEEFLWK